MKWLLIGASVVIGGLALVAPSALVSTLKNPNVAFQSTGPAVVLAADRGRDKFDDAGKADMSGPGMSAEMRSTQLSDQKSDRGNRGGRGSESVGGPHAESKSASGTTQAGSGSHRSEGPSSPSSVGAFKESSSESSGMGNPTR